MTKLMLAAAATAMLAALVAGQWGSTLTRNSGAAATGPAVTLSAPVKIGGGFALTGDESAPRPAGRERRQAGRQGDQRRRRRARPADRLHRPRQPVQDGRHRADRASSSSSRTRSSPVIGYTDTDSVLASGPIFQAAGIPFVTVGATSPEDPQPGRRHDVPGLLRRQRPGRRRRRVLVQASFGKNAYLLWDKGVEYTTLLGQYFKARFTELGGTIALEESYDDKATDFSAQITKIKALPKQPDFYYVAAMPYNIGPIVKQFRDAGLTGPIVGGDGYDTPRPHLRSRGAAANNVYFTTHALMDAQNGTDGIKKFIAAYKTEYGHAIRRTPSRRSATTPST